MYPTYTLVGTTGFEIHNIAVINICAARKIYAARNKENV
jgi:hypothetical protein